MRKRPQLEVGAPRNGRRGLRWFIPLVSLVVLMTGSTGQAAATPRLVTAGGGSQTTVGQNGLGQSCSTGAVWVDSSYVLPSDGTVTSFAFAEDYSNVDASRGQMVDFLVLHPTGNYSYTVVGKTGLKTFTKGSGTESFPANIQAHAGDVLGFYVAPDRDNALTNCFISGGSGTTSIENVASDPGVGDAIPSGSAYQVDLNESATLITPGSALTTTSVTCSPASVRLGLASTCTATVTSDAIHPSGSVSFSSDSSGTFDSTACALVQLGGNKARCSVHYSPSGVGSGSHTITASYTGDPVSAPSSGMTTLTVTKNYSSTSVSCSPSSSVSTGTPTTCTATVTGTNPSGTVAFSRNSSGTFSSPSCTLVAIDGTSASCSVIYTPTYYGTGTHKIYGSYSGDSNNTTSSGNTTITVV